MVPATQNIYEQHSQKNCKSMGDNDRNEKDTPDGNLLAPWTDASRIETMKKNMKVTVCIKNNDGGVVDTEKVKSIITENGIQVTKASVNRKNGDLYVDLPSNENRDKLNSILTEEVLPGNRVINLKQRCPTISIRNVRDYTTEADFLAKIKSQNPRIKQQLENGSEFSVVFTKEHKIKNSLRNDEVEHQVVARVGDDIRASIQDNKDKIYLGFHAHHVVDRFYVKSCSSCHKFGHYHADCHEDPCCGYCCSKQHRSEDCPVHEAKDSKSYKCTNCEAAGKESTGHSSHWPQCPAYLEHQNKMRKNIPFYSKNSK